MRRFCVVFALSPLCLMGNPTHPTVTQGTADFRAYGKTLVVAPSQRAIINWESFSIDAKEITRFVQPGIDAAVLNRVTGDHASEILGTLLANGRVYLINEKGIIFGKDSVIRVAEWIASTHDVLDERFLNGDELLFKGDSTAQIVNLGTIQGASGNAVLIAHRIQNSGHLEAHGGDAACACSCEVLFKPNSAEPISILVKTSEESFPLLENNGTIQAFKASLNAQPEVLSPVNQGQVTLTAQNGRIYLHSAGALLQEGQLTAETIVLNALNCDHSGTSTSSTIDIHCDRYIDSASSNLSADQIHIFAHDHLFSSGVERAVGGSICLESQKIDLVGAHIDASGFSGGKILIGGGSQGKNSAIMNAIELYVNPFSTIRADGTMSGGQVVLWANDRTVFLGETSARGFYQKGTMEISTTHSSLSMGNGAASLNSGVSLPDYPNFQFVDPNAGNGTGFGQQILPLSTGNVVVTKPGDNFSAPSSGAVYLYNGQTGALISSLRGSFSNDQVSGGGAIALTNNGNYVVNSPNWNSSAGAATWGSGLSGVSGTVSFSNSLVGSSAGDLVGGGINGVAGLLSGNYLVSSPYWHGGVGLGFGAVTWGSGLLGISGTITSSNSLVGSLTGDLVGFNGIAEVLNGNYVVVSSKWNSSTGAVTWGSGSSGVSGVVSSSNSLVGSISGDKVGSGTVTVLSNGNYVVNSPVWNGRIGAATWGSGSSGISGTVTSSNSLVGSTSNDAVGINVTGLSNGNYVVISPGWNGTMGAVTWGSGSSGISGTVTSSNSLVGSISGDNVGNDAVTALSNGNYVVISPDWNGTMGAVTWGSGSSGISGTVTSSNSLVGSISGDEVGTGTVTALSNGNYVVKSSNWNDAMGAVTWGSGSSGVSGTISSSNSLVGSNGSDLVGLDGVTALSNGNYVVISLSWNSGLGAVTWGSGSSGISGTVSSSNSLVGSMGGDNVGSNGVTALLDGNYVVNSPNWDGGLGAVTWGSGSLGVSGTITSSNSLVGSTNGDQIGSGGVTALLNGNYVVISPSWNSGLGAVTWGSGSLGVSGTITSLNSLVGSTNDDQIGSGGVTALLNGNYVVISPNWNNGSVPVGAVTWGSGSSGVSGTITSSNSLVGSQSGDRVGSSGVTAFSNGNYVVRSPFWNVAAGAVTWGDGLSGVSGIVSSSNSLIGSLTNDRVGSGGIRLLSSDNYVVVSPFWTHSTGAVTLGSTITGISGPVNSINSVIGGSISSGLNTVVSDHVNQTFISRFSLENTSGVIRVASFAAPVPPVPPAPPVPTLVFQNSRLGASIMLNDLFDFLKIKSSWIPNQNE